MREVWIMAIRIRDHVRITVENMSHRGGQDGIVGG
jgi:hypothetical protein